MRERYDELVALVKEYNRQYHEENASEISDYEFDMLNRELRELEAANPEWAAADSPTGKVGGKVKREAGITVEHNVPMLSIQDVFSEGEVISWVNEVRAMHPDAAFSVEHKIDGLSMTLRYREGKLVMAETRGNGFVGEDVTLNSLTIPDVQAELDIPYAYLEVRGEVYMAREDFERFNQKQEEAGKKIAANPRNLAAGTLRQLDPEITRERGLRLFVFNVQDGDPELMGRHAGTLDYLREKGMAVVPHKLCVTAEEVLAEIDRIGEARGEFAYDIDGAVVKIDQIAYRSDFTAGSKYTPGHIAYKYPPEEKEAEVLEIELSVGRTGKIAPTAILSPVRLCGTTVQRVTLHNQDYIDQKKVGIGGKYLIYKSGEIIPKLKEVTKEPQSVYRIPGECPVCGQPVVREEDTADVKCVNPFCPSQLKRTISYFISRDAMDIKAFGQSYVDQLVDLGYLHSYADIYRLREHREELIEKGILGREKNTDRILAAIDESRENDAVQLLTALGIDNVGRATAKDLMKQFPGIRELGEAAYETLMEIPDVGPTTAQCIVDFFAKEENRELLRQMEQAGVNLENKKKAGVGILEGKTFCITGTLSSMGRKEAEELVEEKGGAVIGVSKKLDYLVAGEKAGSKLEKAEKLGVAVLTEEEFLEMVK